MVRTSTVVVALSYALVACGARQVPLRDQGAVLLAQPQAEGDLRAAIARALAARGFTAEGEQPNVIIARMDRRGVLLRVRVDYSPTRYAISYLESQGMGFQQGPQGPMIGRAYANTVVGLRRAIDEEIGRPNREAAAAVQAQRDHELAVAEQQRQAAVAVADAQRQQSLDAQNAETERERLRTQAAQARAAEAEARRPIIVGHDAVSVSAMAFNARAARAARAALRINPGFMPDPRVAAGTAGGSLSASAMNLPAACRGYYSGQPGHVMVLGDDFNYLRVESHSNSDTTLAIVAPDGSVWCDDDGAGGTDARIAGQFPAGPYRVFVGNYQPDVISRYELTVTEMQPAATVAPAPVAVAPAPAATCQSALIAAGHHSAQLIHCNGVEDRCAVALLQAGHHPAHLIHCRGAEPNCAESLLRSGRNPAELIHCPH